MIKLSEEAKKAIGEIHPAYVATADKSGKPNVSAKGSLRVLDDEHVIFADVNSPRTLANIRKNPQVSIICLDAAQHQSCRIWGSAEVITSGPLLEQVGKELAARKIDVKSVIKVAVDEVEVS
jgi:predicted pyridoxine 5'-phosphate oxidase superfamily flavin-nucleotide-binding protein